MSSAEVAAKIFRTLEPEDFKVLRAVEIQMKKSEFISEELIPRHAKLSNEEVTYRLDELSKHGLLQHQSTPYVGYRLTTAGYDCLAINALVKADVLQAFGKPLGIGKESDVYDALMPDNTRVAVKFHRLGRTSFRQTKRKRGYIVEQAYTPTWLYQSRLAAKKEFEALSTLYPKGISVPKPIKQNRHVIVMSIIEGAELYYLEIPNPRKVLDEILLNIKKAYKDAGIIHADLSPYNIIVQLDEHILIIDWPQYVTIKHPNAEQLLQRDVQNVLSFFRQKLRLETDPKDILVTIKGD
jgi:RIO kinase 2